jgi:transcriptional regulator with GAF, ATPase, and Fis domain
VGIFFFALHNYLRELRTARERDDFYRQVEQRNVELRTVYLVSQDIAASLDLERTMQTVLERVRQIVAYDGAEICLYEEAEGVLRCRAWAGLDTVVVDTRGRAYRLGEGYTGWIGEHRASLLIPDVEAEQAMQPTVRQLGDGTLLNSFLGAPLLVGQTLVGTLELVSSRRGAFDEHARQLIETVAPPSAIAIQHAAQVLERERRLMEQVEQLIVVIDEAKRTQQVAEITETEHFRQLRALAQRLRRGV